MPLEGTSASLGVLGSSEMEYFLFGLLVFVEARSPPWEGIAFRLQNNGLQRLPRVGLEQNWSLVFFFFNPLLIFFCFLPVDEIF